MPRFVRVASTRTNGYKKILEQNHDCFMNISHYDCRDILNIYSDVVNTVLGHDPYCFFLE